jgi:hypothetical protein
MKPPGIQGECAREQKILRAAEPDRRERLLTAVPIKTIRTTEEHEMKFKALLAAASLAVAGTAAAHGPSNILFRFDGGVGVQPFRSAAGVPTLNVVAGVNPGGAPWLIKSFEAVITKSGDIRARGEGVLLGGADGIGTRAGPRQVIVSLFCRNAAVPPAVAGTVQTTPYNSAPVDLDEDGDFSVRGKLTDANGLTPPADCGDTVDNRPVLLIRAVTPANPTTGAPATPGAWFAAGLLAGKRDGSGGHGFGGGY